MKNELTKSLVKSANELSTLVDNHPLWSNWIFYLPKEEEEEEHTDTSICSRVGEIISPDSIFSIRQPWIIDIESIVKDLNYDK